MGCEASTDAAAPEVKEETAKPAESAAEGEGKKKKPFKIKEKEKKEKIKPKKFEGKPYGDLPPHHPAAVQALF